jgi:hypothetical protein
MADGISKGYVKSTTEIAGNMAMLYKLSGNSPLWQGEQGAQRLSQMSNALANATNLESVGDVINYSVVRDILDDGDRQANFYRMMNLDPAKERDREMYTGTYLDEMMVMGRGVNGDILKGQYEYLTKKEGSNEAAIVEHLKNMNGLNDIGGVQLLRMMQRGEAEGWTSEKYEEEQKKITENVDFKSDSQLYRDTMNSLQQVGIKIGQIEFPKTEMKTLAEAMVDLTEALRIRTNPTNLANIAEANEILNEVWNPPSGGGGYEGIPGNRATQTFLTLEDILYHADNEDSRRRFPGEYEIGNRLQGLMPIIGENPGDEVLRLMDDLATQYYEYQDDGIDASEKHRLNETLNSMETVLSNLVSALPNIQNPIPLEIRVTEEMG